jgi:hypothetical protein
MVAVTRGLKGERARDAHPQNQLPERREADHTAVC